MLIAAICCCTLAVIWAAWRCISACFRAMSACIRAASRAADSCRSARVIWRTAIHFALANPTNASKPNAMTARIQPFLAQRCLSPQCAQRLLRGRRCCGRERERDHRRAPDHKLARSRTVPARRAAPCGSHRIRARLMFALRPANLGGVADSCIAPVGRDRYTQTATREGDGDDREEP